VATVAVAALLGSGQAQQQAAPTASTGCGASVPIEFSISEAGYVTLVIEKPDGTRVRNLIAETPFAAGTHTVQWDGMGDDARDTAAAARGEYRVAGRPAAPGVYRVRGLVRPELKVVFELAPYSSGRPPWHTDDRSSGWLSDHTAPSAVLFVPPGVTPGRNGAASSPAQILVGSYIAEGGSGLAWLDLDGHKLWGQVWLGGIWSGTTQLAADAGAHPAPNTYGYAATSWHDEPGASKSELRLRALVSRIDARNAPADVRLGTGEDVAVLVPSYQIQRKPGELPGDQIAPKDVTGLAAYNGLIAVALGSLDQLLFVDAVEHRVVGSRPLVKPRGLAFDPTGRLLAVSGTRVVGIDVVYRDGKLTLSSPQVVVAQRLDDPQYLALDSHGALYVSDWGSSQQVKVFAADGRPLRTIGRAGALDTGPYDPRHMNRPAGLTLDSQGRLWVAENDTLPKRVSVWNASNGRFVSALYGPTRYGGGGTLDPADRSRWYYANDEGGMSFRIDWQTRTATPEVIYYRFAYDHTGLMGKDAGGMPEHPLHRNGRTYVTNADTAEYTGRPSAIIWLVGKDGVARPVAAAGSTVDSTLRLLPAFTGAAMRARMPAGLNPQADPLLFVWSDTNGDGRVQPGEVSFVKPRDGARGQYPLVGGVSVLDDLSFAVAYVGYTALLLPTARVTAAGVPSYDINAANVLARGVQSPTSTGGGQVLVGRDGWAVLTTPPAPFAPESVGGVRNGVPVWSYPSVWPGLHASHASSPPRLPGELIGTTRVLGNPVNAPSPSDVGQLWAINGNLGNVYLFTVDGLFVATLFRDYRRQTSPVPTRAMQGTDVSAMSLQPESFHTTMTQTSDGQVYLQAGASAPLLRIEGLKEIRRIPPTQIVLCAPRPASVQQRPDAAANALAAADPHDQAAGRSAQDPRKKPR
jgi:hypothetical protein